MNLFYGVLGLACLLFLIYILDHYAFLRRNRLVSAMPNEDEGVIYGFSGNYHVEKDGFSSSTMRRDHENEIDVTEKTTVVQCRTYTIAQTEMREQLDGLLGVLAGEDIEPLFVSTVDFLAKRGYKFTGTGEELAEAFNIQPS